MHTPGPWSIQGPSSGKGRYDNGGDYAILSGGEIIAESYRRTGDASFHDALANACLISAACDLLEACRIGLRVAQDNGELDEARMIAEAIQKALGNPS